MGLVKNSIKSFAGTVSTSRLLRPVVTRQLRGRTNVVYYHYVGQPTPYYASFYGGCTFDRFRQDIEALATVFRFESLGQVCKEHSQATRVDCRPSIAITFDDGFKISQPEVLELFERHDIKATTFLTTGCVGNQNLMWRNKLSAILNLAPPDAIVSAYRRVIADVGLPAIKSCDQLLEASRGWNMHDKDRLADLLWSECELPPLAEFLDEHRPYFTWQELDEWKSAGHGVGLHSLTHPFCSQLDDDGVHREIVEPARQLRERLGLESVPFSYPFGDRLSNEQERMLLDDGVIDYVFGIAGFALKHAPAHRLERAGPEATGVAWPVFAQTLLSPARQLLSG